MENNLTSSLVGLNALICCSTSGIGFSTAKEFAKLGANVTLFSRNEEKLNECLSLLSHLNNQEHQYLVGDFNEPNDIQSIINDHIGAGNNYHILINNSPFSSSGRVFKYNTIGYKLISNFISFSKFFFFSCFISVIN